MGKEMSLNETPGNVLNPTVTLGIAVIGTRNLDKVVIFTGTLVMVLNPVCPWEVSEPHGALGITVSTTETLQNVMRIADIEISL